MSSGHPKVMKNSKGAPSGDGWVVTGWRCTCHPGSSWSTYSTADTCQYSDVSIFGPRYAREYHDTYASLAAAHDLIPTSVNDDEELLTEMFLLRERNGT